MINGQTIESPWEWTRWRSLDDPVHYADLIIPGGPRLETGKLPVGPVLLLWNGNALIGPVQFESEQMRDGYQMSHQGIEEFIILPAPNGKTKRIITA